MSDKQVLAPRTVSILLAALTIIVAALGPVTAWVNGRDDRMLQEQKAKDEVALKQLEILLRVSSTEQREASLRLLQRILESDLSSRTMLDIVNEQLEEIQEIPKLQAALSESNGMLIETKENLTASRDRERVLENALRSRNSSDGALQAKLDSERAARVALERELAEQKKRSTELEERIKQTRVASGANEGSAINAWASECCVSCRGSIYCAASVKTECGSCDAL